MSTQLSQVLDVAHTDVNRGDTNTRIYGHYLLAVASLSVYGGQICPYIDSLSQLDNSLLMVLSFTCIALLRPVLYRRWVSSEQTRERMLSVTKLDLGLYCFTAIALSSYLEFNHEVPASSAVKLLFGFFLFGAFAALDSALLEERHSIHKAAAEQGESSFIPLGKVFNCFTVAMCVGLVVVMLLLLSKDMEWLLSDSRQLNDMQAVSLIALEFFVVLGLFLGSSVNVVNQYSKNLSLRLASQARVLGSVAAGDLAQRISDPGSDELKSLSTSINDTLADLEVGHRELAATRDLTIRALSSLAETRDNETGLHIIRTQHYVKLLAQNLSQHPDFAAKLQPDFVELLYKSAPLHDVGKIGIPDHILLKPGKLTDEEFAVMRTHATLGRDALATAAKGNEASAFLCLAQEIALNHHEKWDGTGYPSQLSGEDIPLSARLMALADVYDALVSKRVYKKAMTHAEARAIILEGRGSHFDPRVVDSFLTTETEFVRIANRYGD